MNIDATSETWKEVSKRITARLTALTTEIEGDLPERDTQHIRGQIAALRAVLGFTTNTRQTVFVPQDDYGMGSL